MKRDYIKYFVGLAACSFLGLTSCDDDKDLGENENVIRIMSIHKSKGLEFPVVFLCGTGKGFNMRDLNEDILLHQRTATLLEYCT